MRGLNRVMLLGNLGKDPEMTILEGGVEVAKLKVATTDVYRLKTGEQYADTQWHTVVLWRSLAGLAAKYLKKGGLVYLEGRIRTRVYEDKSGQKRYITEIVGDKLIMLDKRLKEGDDIEQLFDDTIIL